MRPSSRDDIEIAIVCALPLEVSAVEASLDETYSRLRNGHMKDYRDVNIYTIGRIGKHNIVLCPMPGMGKVSAAGVATNLRFSFPNIRLALLVGICGGVPFPSGGAPEIVLGDVLISDRMIEYDFGTQYPGGFQRKTGGQERLGRPNREIRALLSALGSSTVYGQFEQQMKKHLDTIQAQDKKWMRPDVSPDFPLGSSNRHRVHIGTFGCADRVMKSGNHRDLLAKNEGVFGIEMEGAGVWGNVPCVILKGVCDYADRRKNDVWQPYAAAMAAAAAKAFLGCWGTQF